MTQGTQIAATVIRVVDGDTIRVALENLPNEESLRILNLDTEESNAGSNKPVTPWGKAAKARAEAFFDVGDSVTLTFPGDEAIEVCLVRYRGNYGRLLVYVEKNGIDFQETMIREGYSPYFNKYGNANFSERHQRYIAAERDAQAQHIGVWNQLAVNGSEARNYALLSSWWSFRASIIDQFRLRTTQHANLLNTRLDYDRLIDLAKDNASIILFTELSDIVRVGQRSASIRVGSIKQPFSFYLPDIDGDAGQRIAQLVNNRYLSDGNVQLRRSYAFVHGQLSEFRGKPQMIISEDAQITDSLPDSFSP